MGEHNKLFPVFLKLAQMHTVIVGAGNIGTEKLQAIIRNTPGARVTVIAKEIAEGVITIADKVQNISIRKKEYEAADIEDADIVIVALGDDVVCERVAQDAARLGILVNVADKPSLCDFYLGAVTQKGSIKIAVSTNGMSPTIAKRLKEVLEDCLPDEMELLLENMHILRKQLAGDFAEKVKQLNAITAPLVETRK